MSGPLLLTKLYVPPPRPNLVMRPRLIEQLNNGLSSGRKFTLISAPAGFGKTTLVSEWIASCGRQLAWYSVDEGDNDPARFISYIVKALQMLKEGIGDGLLPALQSPQPLQIEVILTNLLNEISTISEHFLLILDDYHTIDSQIVDQSLLFLIEHQPPQMHLVISTREDPSLPLSRMRGRNEVTELRATDLRFTLAETTEFLNRVMGLTLSDRDAAALESRTEGWIAGLQMAAISLQGLPNAASFIESFTGSHRFVLDYLLEEVLKGQSIEVQNFLQCTSILERLYGPLCDAVISAPAGFGNGTLHSIERDNLFIIPLDNERFWYRYHHLFRDLLRKSLEKSLDPEEITKLHINASEWYEKNGLILEAFRHATGANDIERAIRLMESRKMLLHRRDTAIVILDWLESLSDAVRNARPVLWWMHATLLLTIGQTIGVEEKLQAAEKALNVETISIAELDKRTRDLIGKIAAVRSNLAQAEFQPEMILAQGRRALEYLDPGNLPFLSSAIRTMGFAYYWQDDWEKAYRAFNEALSLAQEAGDIPSIMLALIRLGQLQKDRNQLYQAADTFQHALKLIGEYSNPNTAIAYLGLAEIFYQWNDLDVAEQYTVQGLQLAQQYDQITDRIIMSELHLVIIKLARRDISGAAQMVSQAELTSHQKNFPVRLTNIAYFKTWIYIRQGNLDAATQLVKQYEIPLMSARVFILKDEPVSALKVLEKLRQEAEDKGLARRLLDVMAVQSIALYKLGEKEKAVDLLIEVLATAEPQGYIRLFLDEGDLMAQLLLEATSRKIMPDYVARLLAVFEAEKWNNKNKTDPHYHQPLIEPLSQRELEILNLVAQGLSNEEICKKLFLALDTVKGHNRRIFEKLQVHRRTEAIAKARELNLI